MIGTVFSSSRSVPLTIAQTRRKRARRASRAKDPARFRRLIVESLEPRTLLANMAVTNAYLIDLDGDPVAEPTTGTLVRGRVDFTYSGIPSGTPFQVKFTFDNQTYTRNMKTGGFAIFSFTNENWLLEPGPHTFQVQVDSLGQISETNEADNFKTVTINPVTFSSPFQDETRFVTPLGGTWGTHWWINNYADLDTTTGQKADYTGGDETYDGHDALDIDIDGFAAQDIGVPIFAAAGGVVVQRADGNYDRNTTSCKASCQGGYWGNFVVVDHGNGWRTRYIHMRKNSVAVSVGDVVEAGDILGLVGSSGNSTGPHLHFAVYHNDQMVETYVDPTGYWIDPVPYNDGPQPPLVPPSFYYVTENSKNAYIKVFNPEPGVGGEVTYNTVGGSATPGVDYQPKSGVLDFNLLSLLPKFITVPLINDVRREPVEFFFVHTFSNAQGDQNTLVLMADNDAVMQYNLNTSELIVNGNLAADDDDVIVVDIDGTFFRVEINGQTYTFPLALMSKATVFAGSGEDHVYVKETAAGKPVTINAGTGDDIIRVGAGDLLKILDLIDGTLTLNGVSGDDKVYFDDDVPLGPQDYEVLNNSLQRNGTATMLFSNMDDVILNAGPSDDTIDVRAVLNGTALKINGGNGGDTITLGAVVNKLDFFQGNATIDGQAGDDTLLFKDNASAIGRTYELTGSYLIRSNAATVFYGDVEDVALNATGLADTIGVQGTSATTLVNALGGIDTINVMSQQKNLELAGGLTVDGGAGGDTVSFHDENNPYDAGALSKLYTLTNNSVGRWFMAGSVGPFFVNLNYQAAEVVNVYGGSGGNIIGVLSTAAGVGTRIHAGTGDDVVNVGNGSNKLDGIQGTLLVKGLAQTTGDSLVVHDEGQTTPFTYAVTDTTVTRPGIASISFGTVELLQLNAGSANDTINVNSTAALTPATINAGDGNDHIEVNTPAGLDNLKGTLTVNGQGHVPDSLGDGLELRDDPNLLGHTYTINDGLITRNGIAPINYSGIDHLGMMGGTKDDLFKVQSMPDAMIFMGLSGHGGNDTFVLGSPTNTLDAIDQVMISDLGGGFDQVVVNDQGNPNPSSYHVHDFEINRVSSHFVLGYGQSPPEKITFNGGSGGNTFTMHSNSPATPITINSGAGDDTMLMLPTLSAAGLKFDGQGGTNTLDYSAFTDDIYVNLATGQATDVGGGIANFHNVIGGAGSDLLVGDGQANILTGNAGRDLLFGGLAGDSLLGGLDDDLLAGGTTTHTTFAALNALRSEWKRLDADYATRISHLTSGGGLNGATLLNLSTVPSDGVTNRLSGQDDLDWFFANLLDSTDLDPLTEQSVAI